MAEPNIPPHVFPPHIEDTIRSIAQLDVEHHENATLPQRWVDRLTGLLGQPWFIGVASVVIIGWIGLNGLAPALGYRPIDPAPFPWLAGFAALWSFYLVLLILITQRREEQLAMHHAQLTLQLTILGEQKITKVIALLEEYRRDSPQLPDRIDHEADAMAESADPNSLLDAIKEAKSTTVSEAPRGDATSARTPKPINKH
jgi:uncharacterized membrane protein